MRNVRVISVSIDTEVYYELLKFSAIYFGGNKSRAINQALREYIPTCESNKKFAERLRAKMDEELKTSPEEDKQARLEREKQERKSQEEAERKKKSEEYKKSLKREIKIDPKVEELKSDPNYQLWAKHYRQIRTNPDDHDPNTCCICILYADKD